ncbi:cysteine-rich and transmembrane domain-containing protein WIH1-like [Juglans microcarpa x Juglans regia]|uniref:cysteine-rich and transmembrane domain-containing protein WIH1-like n=1 Tax=Juglans microcarpa x Juglans regia TaxID=2249226 RepID=UPI001B7F0C60|nr:cysteine-rich and transmembrane domain-containing protein WIH1-like [Juglans microcarpa x Juglans regia]
MNYHHISHESHLPASGHPISYTSPPQGFLPPPPGYQGYFYEGYPPSQPGLAPSQPYHLEHYNDHDSGCSSILRGCLAALCCFCVLEECCL